MAKARTGNVPMPTTFTGTANTSKGWSGSAPRLVRCSTIGIPASRSSEWMGRSPVEVSSMFTESMPTRPTPAATRWRAVSSCSDGWSGSP
jgi:hypothetical protein